MMMRLFAANFGMKNAYDDGFDADGSQSPHASQKLLIRNNTFFLPGRKVVA